MKNKRRGSIAFLKILSLIFLLVIIFCAPDVVLAQTSWEALTVEQKAELLKKMSPEEMNYIQNELNKPSSVKASKESWDSLTVQEKAELMKKLSPQEQRLIQNELMKSPAPQTAEASWESLTR